MDADLFSVYSKEISKFQPSDRNVAGILYACVSVIKQANKDSEPIELDVEFPEVPPTDQFFDANGSSIRLSDISSNDTLKALIKSTDVMNKLVSTNPFVVEINDSVRVQKMKRLLISQPPKSKSNYSSDLQLFEMGARIRSQIIRMVRNNGFPLRPEMSKVERGIKESELLTFTSLAPSDLYRSNQLQEFAEMILKETKALPNFTGALRVGDGEDGSVIKRKYYRYLPALLFAQVLAEEDSLEPLILQKYYPATDEVLYCLHWPPPDRRNKREVWKCDLEMMSVDDYHDEKAGSRKNISSEGNDEQQPETSPFGVSIETVTITPAGKMIVLLKQMSNDIANPYVTAFLNGASAGVRMIPLQDKPGSIQLEEDEEEGNELSADAAQNQVVSSTHDTNVAGDQTLATNAPLVDINNSLLRCSFFYLSPDQVRYTFFDGPKQDPVVKPDKFGTVCLSVRFPQNLLVTVCSDGNVQVQGDASCMREDNFTPRESEYPLFYERSRFVGAEGITYRRFDSSSGRRGRGPLHPIVTDVLFPDGSRELHLSSEVLQRFRTNRKNGAEIAEETCWELNLLKLIPLETCIIKLTLDGEVYCFSEETSEPGLTSNDDDADGEEEKKGNGSEDVEREPVDTTDVPSKTVGDTQYSRTNLKKTRYVRLRCAISNIVETRVDAETKAKISYYKDGRLVVQYVDGATRVHFPDRTTYHYHPTNRMLQVSRFRGWPVLEIDLDIDAMCRGHAQGLEVPINKGGERVRSRLSLPDGSLVMVKYDTRVTAPANGSMKVVTRDRTQILVADDATLTFQPFTAWTTANQRQLEQDLKIDDVAPATLHALGQTLSHPQHFTPLADLHESSLMQHSLSSTTLPTETSSKIQEDGSRTSHNNLHARGGLPGARATKAGPPTVAVGSATKRASQTSAKSAQKDSGKNLKQIHASSSATTSAIQKDPDATDAHSLFTSTAEPDAVFTVQLRKSLCTIRDYEFNTFVIDLSSGRQQLFQQKHQPSSTTGNENKTTTPKAATSSAAEDGSGGGQNTSSSGYTLTVQLAGEVPGLKPPAVARLPKSPRCFIVNRVGDCTEVLSIQDVSVWECYIRHAPDGFRVDSAVSLPPAELGPCKSLRYFLRKRLLTSYCDGFTFEDALGLARQYSSAITPAAAHYYLDNYANIHYVKDEIASLSLPRIFESLSLLERPPLSQEGYTRILQSLRKCEDFRTQRVKNIDRFAVEDPRTPEQIEEEEMMVKRLKQAYKAAKVTAAKRREQRDRNKGTSEDNDDDDEKDQKSGGDGGSKSGRSRGGGSHKGGKGKGPLRSNNKQQTIVEAQNEDEDEDDDGGMGGGGDDVEFGSEDGEPKELNPVEVHLRNIFDDFVADHLAENNNQSTSFTSDHLLPVGSLQEAFIQIFNRIVDTETVEQAAYDCGEVDPDLEEVTFHEFRAIYYSLKKLLHGSANSSLHSQNQQEEDADDDLDRSYDEDGLQISHNGTARGSTPGELSHGGYNRQRQASSAPPLNFDHLNLDSVDNISIGMASAGMLAQQDVSEANSLSGAANGGGSLGSFAAGSGLRMVRNVRNM